jgi:hypothetical protein
MHRTGHGVLGPRPGKLRARPLAGRTLQLGLGIHIQKKCLDIRNVTLMATFVTLLKVQFSVA